MASMQFCRSCSNMLYPKEDRIAKKLVFVCRRCQYEQDADNPVVYRRELVRSAVDELEHTPDSVIDDPTLMRQPVLCARCGNYGAVIIQAKLQPGDTRMKLIYVCTNPDCVHKWHG